MWCPVAVRDVCHGVRGLPCGLGRCGSCVLRAWGLQWCLQPGLGRIGVVTGGEGGVVCYVRRPLAMLVMVARLFRVPDVDLGAGQSPSRC